MSLLIGEHISGALGLSAIVASKFGGRIFPIVIPEGVSQYPYIVYGGLSIQPDYTKDGAGQDNTQVQVTVVGKGAGKRLRWQTRSVTNWRAYGRNMPDLR